LIQTFGRAARNIDGAVIMYADQVTRSIIAAIAETDRRRETQIRYNKDNAISPKSVVKSIPERTTDNRVLLLNTKSMTKSDLIKLSLETEASMKKFAEELDFEKAIEFREKLSTIKKAIGEPMLSEVH
jgi:excinuclease ABC subunit B